MPRSFLDTNAAKTSEIQLFRNLTNRLVRENKENIPPWCHRGCGLDGAAEVDSAGPEPSAVDAHEDETERREKPATPFTGSPGGGKSLRGPSDAQAEGRKGGGDGASVLATPCHRTPGHNGLPDGGRSERLREGRGTSPRRQRMRVNACLFGSAFDDVMLAAPGLPFASPIEGDPLARMKELRLRDDEDGEVGKPPYPAALPTDLMRFPPPYFDHEGLPTPGDASVPFAAMGMGVTMPAGGSRNSGERGCTSDTTILTPSKKRAFSLAERDASGSRIANTNHASLGGYPLGNMMLTVENILQECGMAGGDHPGVATAVSEIASNTRESAGVPIAPKQRAGNEFLLSNVDSPTIGFSTAFADLSNEEFNFGNGELFVPRSVLSENDDDDIINSYSLSNPNRSDGYSAATCAQAAEKASLPSTSSVLFRPPTALSTCMASPSAEQLSSVMSCTRREGLEAYRVSRSLSSLSQENATHSRSRPFSPRQPSPGPAAVSAAPLTSRYLPNPIATAGALITVSGRRVPVDKLHLLRMDADLDVVPSARPLPAQAPRVPPTPPSHQQQAIRQQSTRPQATMQQSTRQPSRSGAMGEVGMVAPAVRPSAGAALDGPSPHFPLCSGRRQVTAPRAPDAESDESLVVELQFVKGRPQMRFLLSRRRAVLEKALLESGVGWDAIHSILPAGGAIAVDAALTEPFELIGQGFLAYIFSSRSTFKNIAYNAVGVCTHVSRMSLDPSLIEGRNSKTSTLSAANHRTLSTNTLLNQKGVVFDGIIIRSVNAAQNLSDTKQQLRMLQIQSWAQAECERQFRFLNMPFELKMVHISFDEKICVVYYQINAKEDRSSEPNVSRLLRVLQYHLSCKVHLVRWPEQVEQKGKH